MRRRKLILLVTFLLVYASINFYFWRELHNSGLVDVRFGLMVSGFFGLMSASPLLVSLTWGTLPVLVRYVLGTVAFYWTALMMQFLSWSLMFRLLRLLGQPFLNAVGADWHFPVGGRADLLIPMAITLAVTVYGLYEATQIRSVQYEIRSKKIPPGLSRFRIVQMSDLHLGMLENRWRLERVLTKVESAEPDLLVSTGDLIDVHLQNRDWLVQRLKRVTPPAGKFAVTGNHEVYAGFVDAVTFLKAAGFHTLQGTSARVTPFLGIAGVDDADAVSMELIPEPDEIEILSHLSAQCFRLFLKHTPTVDSPSRGLFELQLSGHTHGGQVFPLFLIPWLVYGFGTGLTDLGDGAQLLVSRGAGTWGPPIRVFAPPEICVIDLLPLN